MKRVNLSNPKKDRLRAASKARRKRRQVKRVELAQKLLKGMTSKMKTLHEIIAIQQKEIDDLKTPAPIEAPHAK